MNSVNTPTKKGKEIERLLEQIQYEAFTNSFKDIARLHRVSDSTVECIFADYATTLMGIREKDGIEAPRVLGIDEKHIQHKMRGILSDIETGTPLDFPEDNKYNYCCH